MLILNIDWIIQRYHVAHKFPNFVLGNKDY